MQDVLAILAEGEFLTAEQARLAVRSIMAGQCHEVEMAAFLTALRVRGETVDELVGAASALRDCMTPMTSVPVGLLDTCGTGGDHAGTFNISTAAALVVAGCGVPVAKHGNRGVSSSSGSADALRCLGVNLDADHQTVSQCLHQVGIAFFFAPQWHPAMKHAMPVRRQLRFRTIFNLLGPLANPARASYQLLGVGRPEWADKLAAALARLGTTSATVVSGSDGLDEVTLAGTTRALCVRQGQISTRTWTPETFGLPTYATDAWRSDSPESSAALIGTVLEGKPGPCRDIVLANAAAALWTADQCPNPRAGVALAAAAIDNGAARAKLQQWIDFSKS